MITPKGQQRKVVKGRELPVMKVVSLDTAKPIRIASVLPTEKGLVIDYNLSGSISNFVLRSDTTYFVSGAVSFSGTNWVEGGTVVKYANTNSAKLSFDGTVNWPSAQYRPAIFTAADDRTVGEDISGWTNSPTGNLYADVAIESTSISKIENVRVLYASKALRFSGSSTFGLSHAQILNCDTAIDGSGGGRVDTRNILIYNVNNGYKLDNFKAGVEHLTFYGATNFYTTNNITNTCVFATNSILVGVTNINTTFLSTNKTWVYSSAQAGSVFESVGAGGHYLSAGSTNRNTGTTNINYSLLQALKKRTTYPPLVYSGNLPASMFLVEQAYRDTDTPDLGYHYDAIDYALGNANVTNSINLFVKPGTVLGVFNTNSGSSKPGLNINGGSSVLASVGHPHNLNRFVVFNTVQEQPSSSWYPNVTAVVAATNNSATLSAQFRFTEWSMLGTNTPHYLGSKTSESVSVMDNQFRGGMVQSLGPSLNITNSLFERSVLNLGSNASSAYFHNNTFFGGAVTLSTNLSGTWTFLNNFFDQATVTQTGTVSQQTNAYAYHFDITNYSRLTPTNATTDVLMATNMAYVQGVLGSFYIATNSALVNAGGRSATNAGLYHHTTHRSQVKETNSVVDIGFHYVAVNDPEVSKSTMTADASSTITYDGWTAAKAIDGILTDVGWHNHEFGTGEDPAFLRLDMGSAKAVNRVAYLPRDDGPFGDYGRFLEYAIYVTDSFSSDTNNWGSPAAVGTWEWSAGKHREDVYFAPVVGRYVIFRRITAEGHHEEEGDPGYASVDEVWVYEKDGPVVVIDTDGDSLPDYFEDKDGNGGTGTGETSFTATDTDGNGVTDALEDPDGDGLSNLLEYLYGLNPGDNGQTIAVRLAYFPFDATNFVGSAGQLPLQTFNVTNIASWKTNALMIPYGTNQIEVTELLNVDFGGDEVSPKSGYAATGLSGGDFWNATEYFFSGSNLLWSDQTPSPITFDISGGSGAWASGHDDPMMYSFYYGGTMTLTLSNVPAGTHDLYIYAHGDTDANNSAVSVSGYDTQYTSTVSEEWTSTTWTEGWQYVLFSDVVVDGSGIITVVLETDAGWQANLNGFQLVTRTSRTNAARLAYRDTETNGLINLAPAKGSVRFWYKPDWTSSGSGGAGPTNAVRLLDVGQADVGSTNGWWGLFINTNGSELTFGASTNGASTNFVTGSITNWASNAWHQVVITYDSSSSALYLDGALSASGSGVSRIPPAGVRATYGLNVGGDSDSSQVALGQFEELETFNYLLTTNQIATDYANALALDTDGDGLTDFFEDRYGFNPLVWNDPNADTDYDGRSDLQEQGDGTDPTSALSVISVRLAYFPFDSTNFAGSAGQLPVYFTNVTNIASWKTNAVKRLNDTPVLDLINLNFGDSWSNKVGLAATGLATNDYWNGYSYPFQSLVTVTNLRYSDSNVSAVSVTVTNAAGQWGNGGLPDAMYETFIYSWNTDPITVTLSNLTAGTYDIYLYGHGDYDAYNDIFSVTVGSTNYGNQSTTTNSDWNSSTWLEGRQYVVFRNVAITNGGSPMVITSSKGGGTEACINGLQLVRKTPTRLAYREAETNGNANVNLAKGSVLFWHKPDWSNTNSGGSGPGTESALLRVGIISNWWGINVTSNGAQLQFGACTNGVSTNYIALGLTNWVSNVWHQVAITYSSTNTILYIDGQSVASGNGISRYPSAAHRSSGGLNVGSDSISSWMAFGQFEELETFNYVLSAGDILSSYQAGDALIHPPPVHNPAIGVRITRPRSGAIIP
jgi:hypothetical protein